MIPLPRNSKSRTQTPIRPSLKNPHLFGGLLVLDVLRTTLFRGRTGEQARKLPKRSGFFLFPQEQHQEAPLTGRFFIYPKISQGKARLKSAKRYLQLLREIHQRRRVGPQRRCLLLALYRRHGDCNRIRMVPPRPVAQGPRRIILPAHATLRGPIPISGKMLRLRCA